MAERMASASDISSVRTLMLVPVGTSPATVCVPMAQSGGAGAVPNTARLQPYNKCFICRGLQAPLGRTEWAYAADFAVHFWQSGGFQPLRKGTVSWWVRVARRGLTPE